MTTVETTIAKLWEKFPKADGDTQDYAGGKTFTVPRESLLDTARFLRDDPELCYELLLDITALDWLPREPRFDLLYSFVSIQKKARIRLRVPLPEQDARAPSLTPIFVGANFYEREVFDLFGISFTGHPFMYRILLPIDTIGHPLRKDAALGYETVEMSVSVVASPRPRHFS